MLGETHLWLNSSVSSPPTSLPWGVDAKRTCKISAWCTCLQFSPFYLGLRFSKRLILVILLIPSYHIDTQLLYASRCHILFPRTELQKEKKRKETHHIFFSRSASWTLPNCPIEVIFEFAAVPHYEPSSGELRESDGRGRGRGSLLDHVHFCPKTKNWITFRHLLLLLRCLLSLEFFFFFAGFRPIIQFLKVLFRLFWVFVCKWHWGVVIGWPK